MLRVGGHRRGVGYARCEGYTNIPIISRGKAPWNKLSPFNLGPVRDPLAGSATNVENFWQFLKVYPKVARQRQVRKKEVVWQHPAETHAILTGDGWQVLPAWHEWKAKGFATPHGIRHPNGTVRKNGPPIFSLYDGKALGYIDARKQIYVPTYRRLLEAHPLFQELLQSLQRGERLMLIDVDGPDPREYPEGIEISLEVLQAKLKDTSKPFGHGYCAAWSLLDALELLHE